ncbi:MAG: DUF192 domain-containing protein [Phycisphaerales bacterium]|nr:DUF192 domain-containing protein [Phycisphaerales bacterium]
MNRVLVLICALLAAGCQATPRAADSSPASTTVTTTFAVRGLEFQPEIVHDDEDRALGLQNRTAPDNGLMLVFPTTSRHSLWMPNCPEDLEAWVISDSGVILEVLQLPAEPACQPGESTWQYHARLPRHRASYPARILWEFSAGTASQLEIRPGDQIIGSWSDVLAGSRYRSSDLTQSR